MGRYLPEKLETGVSKKEGYACVLETRRRAKNCSIDTKESLVEELEDCRRPLCRYAFI